jgi:hypothetical protein
MIDVLGWCCRPTSRRSRPTTTSRSLHCGLSTRDLTNVCMASKHGVARSFSECKPPASMHFFAKHPFWNTKRVTKRVSADFVFTRCTAAVLAKYNSAAAARDAPAAAEQAVHPLQGEVVIRASMQRLLVRGADAQKRQRRDHEPRQQRRARSGAKQIKVG